MKKIFVMGTALLLLSVGISSAQENLAPVEPGPEHKLLARDAGTWDCKILLFIAETDQVEESVGVETNKLVCGKLWLQTSYQGAMMGVDFEGTGLTGYDQNAKKYVGYWVDNLSSSPAKMEGEYDEKTQTLSMMVTGVGPDGQPIKQRHVTKYIGDNKKMFTIYMEGAGGEEVKMMEMTATRRGSQTR